MTKYERLIIKGGANIVMGLAIAIMMIIFTAPLQDDYRFEEVIKLFLIFAMVGCVFAVIGLVQFVRGMSMKSKRQYNSLIDESVPKHLCQKCELQVRKGEQVCPRCGQQMNW